MKKRVYFEEIILALESMPKAICVIKTPEQLEHRLFKAFVVKTEEENQKIKEKVLSAQTPVSTNNTL